MTSYQTEAEHWEAWERGETRCPYCVGLDPGDFAAICDCSRYSLETTGQPITIQVIGSPDTATTVPPHHIVNQEDTVTETHTETTETETTETETTPIEPNPDQTQIDTDTDQDEDNDDDQNAGRE